MEAQNCPACGGALAGTQGQTRVTCPFCGVEVSLNIHPVESMQAQLERKARVESKMTALMERYSDAFVAGDVDLALRCYEAFTYLLLWTVYDVPELSELEAMVTPLMRETARQIDAAYTPPVDRRETVTWTSVDALVAG